MRRFFAIIVLGLVMGTCMAAPVRNMPVVRIQPKGDTLRCFVTGDEFFHRLHDAEGYTIVQNPATGEYVYATLEAGRLVPTRYLAGSTEPAAVGLTPNLMPCKEELMRMHKAWEVPEQYRPATPKTSGANHGTLNNVVIFVRFSDESNLTSSSFSTIANMFNDSSASAVSMYNYFKRSSYNNLRVRTSFYPAPSGSTVLSYQDIYPRSYYKPYSATNTNGYTNSTESRNREFSLLERAVNWVNANSPVPTSLNIDMNNDGEVDNICFVLSGTYTDWNDLLWPHKWSLYDRYVYINNKRVYTYNLQLAGSGSHYFSVSTFCHEMTHTLGCPDIYNYYEYTNVSPGGSWDLMNNNLTPPQQTNSLFKYKYLNWFDSIPELRDSGTYTMQSLASGPNHAYKIASMNRHQWYILEYRDYSDTFDSSIPGRGLLVWRYNDNMNADNAAFDFFTIPNELWLFRPNSAVDTIAGTVSQASFGVSGRNSFSATSNPHPYLCDGTPDTSFALTNITISSDHRSVSFTFIPSGSRACGPLTTFPQTEGFESGDWGCWDYVSATTSNDNKVGVYDSASCLQAPHSGNYHWRFSSWSTSTDYNQFLISPRLQAGNPLHLKFYYKKSYSATENFSVRYSTSTNDTSAFVHTLSDVAVTTSGWHLCDLLLPATAKYVAINYYSNYEYYLYIDDITLRDTLGDIYVHDTTYITIHDTLTNVVHDTMTHWVHDTLTRWSVDTVVHHHLDTVYVAVVDTVYRTVMDSVLDDSLFGELFVEADDTEKGRCSGGGHYPMGSIVEIAAIPNAGCHFDHWDDGTTQNPKRVMLNGDNTWTAFFSREAETKREQPRLATVYVHDTVYEHDTVWVTVHDTTWVTAHDTIWVSRVDTVVVDVHDTIFIPREEHDTVYVDVHTVAYYSIVVTSYDPTRGYVAGSGQFPFGTEMSIGAIARQGFVFDHWDDGNTENPRMLHPESDMSLVAYFKTSTQGVEDVEEVVDIVCYAVDHHIVVENPQMRHIVLFNTLGQQILQSSGQKIVTSNLPTGLYLMKADNRSARKIVIP